MFYCNPCGEERGWPTDAFMRSRGPCEMCGKTAVCNDVASRNLPVPKMRVEKASSSKPDFADYGDIILGGDDDRSTDDGSVDNSNSGGE